MSDTQVDIVERLRATEYDDLDACKAADLIESLRQQLAESQERAEAIRKSLDAWCGQIDAATAKARMEGKLEALLEAAERLESYDYIKNQPAIMYAEAHELRRMADELKG